MIFYMPNIKSTFAGFNTLASLAARAVGDNSPEIEINFSQLSWFDATMSAPLGVVIAKLTDDFKSVSLVGAPTRVERILRKNGFLRPYGFAPLPDANRTTMPYQRFKLSEMGLFADYLGINLPGKGLPNMTSDLALAFQQSLYEIFNNAVTHSGSDQGVFVCGQFFPFDHRLDISMADAGVGIPYRVNQGYHALLDDDRNFWESLDKSGFLDEERNIKPAFALRVALAENSTTKTGRTPGGAGLKIIKKFIEHNGGCIQIASGGAFWEFSKGEDTFNEIQLGFPGTAVNLEINTADTKSYCLAPPPQ
jgi:hypothetical protein